MRAIGLVALSMLMVGWSGCGNAAVRTADAATAADASPTIRLLVFSRTLGFRHDAIPAALEAVRDIGARLSWTVDSTEDAAAFSSANLATYDLVAFLMTTGDVLDDGQQAAFEGFIRSGRGYLGVHSASDTEYDWPWYGALVGAYFLRHPPITTAAIDVREPRHPAAAGLPARWVREDEYYTFQSNVAATAGIHVVLALDEDSFNPPAEYRMGDHPVAWYHQYDGGRAFYTALGHTQASYADASFRGHLEGALRWTAGVP